MSHNHGDHSECDHPTPKWCALKDREFYEESALLGRYLEAAQKVAPPPISDSPLVDVIETAAFTFFKQSRLPNDPTLRGTFMAMLEGMGNIAFTAGVQYAIDNKRPTGYEEFVPADPIEDEQWNDETAGMVKEWRERVRSRYYPHPKTKDESISEEVRAALKKLLRGDVSPEMLESLGISGGEAPETGLYL